MFKSFFILLPKIAWRNIWRHRARSLVVMGSVVLSIWALVFMLAFVRGMVFGYIEGAIQKETSHLQLHHPEFPADLEMTYVIGQGEALADSLRGIENVRAVSARLQGFAMVATAHGVRGLKLQAVDPIQEERTTAMPERIVAGTFFTEDGKNEIVLSRTVAEKLNADIGRRVVITFQNTAAEITSAALRVTGLFDSGNRRIDESTAYMLYEDFLPLTGLDGRPAHEIAVLLNHTDRLSDFQQSMRDVNGGLLIRTYGELSPDLELFDSQIRINLIIMTVIIMLALIFGIVNTMLMAVLERIREIGMLMAIGMTRIRVFLMIIWETVFLALAGAPIGLFAGYLTIRSLSKTGIDLSLWSAALAQFGMSPMVYPVLDNATYLFIAFAMAVTAFLASLYPALKATRLRPVDALRKQ